MNPGSLLVVAAYNLGRAIFGGTKLSWSDIEKWIATGGNAANYGRGFAGGRLSTPKNAYVEIRRESRGKEWQVEASLVLDARQGIAAKKIWMADDFDSKLSKKFGDNNRFRIDI